MNKLCVWVFCMCICARIRVCMYVFLRWEGSGAAESCWQKRHEGLLQWAEGSVGTQKEGTCSPEINRWNGDFLWQLESCRKMEWTDELLNVPGDINNEALDNIPQHITKINLDEIPTMDEMARAIACLKDGKTPWGDGIPAEVLKHGRDNLFNRLHQLITNAWEVGSVPQAWEDASIANIYKKGDRTDCGNYRWISLLSIAGKIFARILLNRLSTHITPDVVPETQCGFRGNRSTVGMIFCLRQLQENCTEQDRPHYMVFVDFSKAFDTLGRPGLW